MGNLYVPMNPRAMLTGAPVRLTQTRQSRREKVDYDMKGNGLQNGGTLVVDAGGKVLLSVKQDNPSDRVDNGTILRVLGLDTQGERPQTSGGDTQGERPQASEDDTQGERPQASGVDDSGSSVDQLKSS